MSQSESPNVNLYIPHAMTNYIFIHNGMIMNGAANVLILSLLNEFLSIATCKDFVHNIELSQYFVINGLDKSCTNCEIVLRYSNTVIPDMKGKTSDKTYYFMNRENLGDKKIGLIELFVKKIFDEKIIYERIDAVNISDHIPDSLNDYYLYTERIDSVKKLADRAICRCLTDALNATYDSGEIMCGDASKLTDLTEMTKELIDQSVSSSKKIQNLRLEGKTGKSLVGTSPSDHMCTLSKIIDQSVQSIEENKKSVLNPDMDIVTLLSYNNSLLKFDVGVKAKHQIYLSIAAVVSIVPRSLLPSNSLVKKINSTIYCLSDTNAPFAADTIPSKELKSCRNCEQITSIVSDIVQKHRKKIEK